MTDKELRKLSRLELIDIIYEAQRRYEACAAENRALQAKLEERDLKIANAGSIAQAALSINHVFEAAQAAADQYISSLKAAKEAAEGKVAEAEEEARKIIARAREDALGLAAEARANAAQPGAEQAERLETQPQPKPRAAEGLDQPADEGGTSAQ